MILLNIRIGKRSLESAVCIYVVGLLLPYLKHIGFKEASKGFSSFFFSIFFLLDQHLCESGDRIERRYFPNSTPMTDDLWFRDIPKLKTQAPW